jgi:hypothetical protein
MIVSSPGASRTPSRRGPDRLLAGALTDVVRPRLVQVLEEDGVLFTRYVVDR